MVSPERKRVMEMRDRRGASVGSVQVRSNSARCYQLKAGNVEWTNVMGSVTSRLTMVRLRYVTVEIWWHHAVGRRDARKPSAEAEAC